MTNYPTPRTSHWNARDFRFHDGTTLPEVRLAYTTVGDPGGEPVLVLHGTTGSAANMLTPTFAGELFGPGQPLDAKRNFIILPDSLGAGQSAKPSDGMRTRFPRYTYDDMVDAQMRLVTEGLGISRLRLVLGNSMGGMHAWIWATRYPGMMDAVVAMAAQPTAMSSRNWLMRRMIIDAIRNDPDWQGGNYTEQPRAVRIASIFQGIATNGGTIAWSRQAPTREAADRILAERLAEPFKGDANDLLYLWEASRDYDPESRLDHIQAHVLAINAADDERNPPETGLMQRAMARVKHGRYHLIPASEATRGHATTAMAGLWKVELARHLSEAPYPALRT
jgi:homoserine O-acetyltransferase/O-succinyltransferase